MKDLDRLIAVTDDRLALLAEGEPAAAASVDDCLRRLCCSLSAAAWEAEQAQEEWREATTSG